MNVIVSFQNILVDINNKNRLLISSIVKTIS